MLETESCFDRNKELGKVVRAEMARAQISYPFQRHRPARPPGRRALAEAQLQRLGHLIYISMDLALV